MLQYKLEQEEELEFDDLDDESDCRESPVMNPDQAAARASGGLRTSASRQSASKNDHNPSVEGLIVPGIPVKATTEIANEYASGPIATGTEANPAAYALQGGLMKSLKEHLASFLTNSPEFNVLLCSVLVNICSYPVKLDVLDGQFNSTTNFYDRTHANLTLLHMILFDQPLSTQDVDLFSIMSALEQVHQRVADHLRDDTFALLTVIARKEGNMREQTIPILQNAWLTSAFQLNRKQIFNAVIFKELLKSLVSVLSAKELVSDMLAAYEAACIEDTQLEASLTVFSRKKQAEYLK